MRIKTRLYQTLILITTPEAIEVFEMRCLRAIRGITKADRMRNSQVREETSPLNLYQMSPDIEDSGGEDTLVVCQAKA